MAVEQYWNYNWKGKLEVLGDYPAEVPLFSTINVGQKAGVGSRGSCDKPNFFDLPFRQQMFPSYAPSIQKNC